MKFTKKTELLKAMATRTSGTGYIVRTCYIVRYSGQKIIADWCRSHPDQSKPELLNTWMIVSEEEVKDRFVVEGVFHRGNLSSLDKWVFNFCAWVNLP